MTKFLVLWKMDTKKLPESPEELIQLDTRLMNMIKADMKSGRTLEWGMFAGGSLAGYAICEGDELEITKENMKYIPYIMFKTYPILSASQVEEMIKAKA